MSEPSSALTALPVGCSGAPILQGADRCGPRSRGPHPRHKHFAKRRRWGTGSLQVRYFENPKVVLVAKLLEIRQDLFGEHFHVVDLAIEVAGFRA